MKKLKLDQLNRLSVEDFKKSKKHDIVVVLDNVRSMNNVGSIFRTSDSFKVDKIFLCGITAVPPHREIHRSALGAEQSVEWQYFEYTADAILHLIQLNYEIMAIEQTDNAIMLQDFIPNIDRKYAFVFGNEVDGVSENVIEIIGKSIEIPQFGSKHSLNISVCAGIILWDYVQKINF